jgi:hypothetical protein
MALARSIGGSSVTNGTAAGYTTHMRCYLIFCLFANDPPICPLILDAQDLNHLTSYRVQVRVDNRFTQFALYLASQPDPKGKKARNYTYQSIIDYTSGARRGLSIMWGMDLSSLQNEQLGYSTFKKGLKKILDDTKKVRRPISPQMLLGFAALSGLVPVTHDGRITRWVHARAAQSCSLSRVGAIALDDVQLMKVSAMFMCACIFAWSKLLRVSEFTSKTSRFLHERELSRADVVLGGYDTADATTTGLHNPRRSQLFCAAGSPGFVDATIKHHKTVASAGPFKKRTYVSHGGALCAVSIVAFLLEVSPTPDDRASTTPMFFWPNGSPLTQAQFRTWLHDALEKLGVEASEHNTHSLRQGGASALKSLGVSDLFIKLIGRWIDSNMPLLYSSTTTDEMQRHQGDMGRIRQLTFVDK